jgi:hypothetical protein
VNRTDFTTFFSIVFSQFSCNNPNEGGKALVRKRVCTGTINGKTGSSGYYEQGRRTQEDREKGRTVPSLLLPSCYKPLRPRFDAERQLSAQVKGWERRRRRVLSPKKRERRGKRSAITAKERKKATHLFYRPSRCLCTLHIVRRVPYYHPLVLFSRSIFGVFGGDNGAGRG